MSDMVYNDKALSDEDFSIRQKLVSKYENELSDVAADKIRQNLKTFDNMRGLSDFQKRLDASLNEFSDEVQGEMQVIGNRLHINAVDNGIENQSFELDGNMQVALVVEGVITADNRFQTNYHVEQSLDGLNFERATDKPVSDVSKALEIAQELAASMNLKVEMDSNRAPGV